MSDKNTNNGKNQISTAVIVAALVVAVFDIGGIILPSFERILFANVLCCSMPPAFDSSSLLAFSKLNSHLLTREPLPRTGLTQQQGDSCGGTGCTTPLQEDPSISCYRRVHAPVTDSHGVTHSGSLYSQLQQAAGIRSTLLNQQNTNICTPSSAYDCSGVFYDSSGKGAYVPNSTSTGDADIKKWKARVSEFYQGVYTDAHAHSKLSPGKAALCTKWAEIKFQKNPDPSILNALDSLQKFGAESTVNLDRQWLDNIISAGGTAGCGVLPLPTGHDMDSWVVPQRSAREFLKNFRDAHNILNVRLCSQQETWFVGK